MELPLSKREWKLYRELKALALSGDLEFDSRLCHKYEEWLILLVEHGVLHEIRACGVNIYSLEIPFDDFEDWIKDQDKKAKRLKKREWVIAIVSAIVGALIGLIPTFYTLLTQ